MSLNEKRGNIMEELDPRMKLLLMVAFSISTFLSVDSFAVMLNYSLILLLFFFCKLYILGLKVFIYIALLMLLEAASAHIQSEQFRDILGMLAHFFLRFSVIIIMGIWIGAKMRIGDFVTAMENMRMPKGITITMAVVFRYMPTVKQEFYYIKNTMKLRGIGISFKNIALRPLQTIEYAIVPLIIRCFTISDQLSASAMTRGLDLETKRVSYREIKLKAADVIAFLIFTGAIVSVSIFTKGGFF